VSRRRISTSREIARLVRRCIEEGGSVEIDGLGVFRPNGAGRFEFIAETRPQVFLAYAVEDAVVVERLYDSLRARGLDPWMDRRKLLPGQNWPRSIERAIEMSSYFIACFSGRSVSKRGHFQAEMRYALGCARRLPLGEIYFIPARLEECAVPAEISRDIQYVDLFPNWDAAVDRVVAVMRRQERERGRPLGPVAA
jgi:hypothetical protein